MGGRRIASHVTLCAFAFSLASAFASAQTAPSQDSVEFARAAAESFAALTQSSEKVSREVKDESVRAFAADLSSVAERASDRLDELCRQNKIELQAGTPRDAALDQAAGQTYERVFTLEASQQLARARGVLEAASKSPRVEQGLRDFAAQTLPSVSELGARADTLARAQAGVGTGAKRNR